MCQLFIQYFKNIINKFIYYVVDMIFIIFNTVSAIFYCNWLIL